MKYLLPALAALVLAVPAVAHDDGQAEPAAKEATDDSQNRMICKRQKATGSRLGSEQVCMTAAQWEQLRRDQRQATERTQANRWTDGGG